MRPFVRLVFRSIVAATVGLSLSSCVGGLSNEKRGGDPVAEERLQVAMALATKEPDLTPGDTFVYDNPAVTWRVDARRPDGGVEWSANNGERQITAANPLLPALAWESPTRGVGKRLISGLSEPMFPLIPGKTVTFRATVDADRPPYAWEFDWTCTLGDFAPTIVPAGTFEAIRVSCGRQTPDELVFHYAPAVGNYVKLAVATGSGSAPVIRQLQTFKRVAMASKMAEGAAPKAADPSIETEVMLEGGQADGSSVASVSQGSSGLANSPTVLGMITGVSPSPEMAPKSQMQSSESGGEAESMDVPASALDSGVGTAVHLASYKDPANAEKGWQALVAGNGDQLTNLRPVIRQVEIPGRGVFYRLHAGPLASATAAEAMCQTLTSRGVYCKAVTLQ